MFARDPHFYTALVIQRVRVVKRCAWYLIQASRRFYYLMLPGRGANKTASTVAQWPSPNELVPCEHLRGVVAWRPGAARLPLPVWGGVQRVAPQQGPFRSRSPATYSKSPARTGRKFEDRGKGTGVSGIVKEVVPRTCRFLEALSYVGYRAAELGIK